MRNTIVKKNTEWIFESNKNTAVLKVVRLKKKKNEKTMIQQHETVFQQQTPTQQALPFAQLLTDELLV